MVNLWSSPQLNCTVWEIPCNLLFKWWKFFVQQNIHQLINEIGYSEKWNKRQCSFCKSLSLAEIISSVNTQIWITQVVNNFNDMKKHNHICYCDNECGNLLYRSYLVRWFSWGRSVNWVPNRWLVNGAPNMVSLRKILASNHQFKLKSYKLSLYS